MIEKPKRRLLMVVNEDRFFLTHRLPVALAAREAGWDVTVLCCDTGLSGVIIGHGLGFVPLPMIPARLDPRGTLSTVRILARIYRENADAVVHHVGMKLILIGMMAARLSGKGRIVNAVSGLGTLFSHDGLLPRLTLSALHRLCGSNVAATIFQNSDDEDVFRRAKIAAGRVIHTYGSGIDLCRYPYVPYPTGTPKRVVFTGRMLREKGVEDFCEAAEILRPEMEGKVEFLLCGGLSANPRALSHDDLVRLTDGRYIRWLGQLDDVMPVLASSVAMVFPSYYREGLPKSLIEAAATGRAIVTTDSVGCRDTVVDGVNGYIVPVRAPKEIAERLRELLSDDTLCKKMGEASRRLAEERYDIRDVIDAHLGLYAEALE